MLIMPYEPMTRLLPTARVRVSSPIPRHHQVRQILLDMVSEETWRPGDQIPAEIAIAEAVGVSKMTVNKAILSLTADGVLYREIGRGTFIAGSADRRHTAEPGASTEAATIEVVIPDAPERVSDNEYLCALLLFMRRCSNPLDVTILLRQLRGRDYLPQWRLRDSSGWLVIAPELDDVAGLTALSAAGAHAVVVGASWNGVSLPRVDSDNAQGARIAIEHLASLGHRKIAFAYAASQTSNTRDRLWGYRDAMNAHALRLDARSLIDCGADYLVTDEMRGRIAHALLSVDRPTALFAGGPFIACTALDVARDLGLHVPDQLSVVGFDDPTAVESTSPALTTVRQPLEEMAESAVCCLRDWIASGADAAQPAPLPCELLVRDSSAKAAD